MSSRRLLEILFFTTTFVAAPVAVAQCSNPWQTMGPGESGFRASALEESGSITELTSTNGLAMTIGSF